MVFGRDDGGGIKQIVRAHIGNAAGDGQMVLRQAHTAIAQVRLNLLVLDAVKSIGFQQRVEILGAVGLVRALRNQVFKHVLHHSLEFRQRVAGSGEMFQLNATHGSKAA